MRPRLLRQTTDNVNFTIRYVLTNAFRGCNRVVAKRGVGQASSQINQGPQGVGAPRRPQNEILAFDSWLMQASH